MAFIERNTQDESVEDVVEQEFDRLNDEIVGLTNGKARVIFAEMSEEEVNTYFKEPKEESYFVELRYSLTREGKLYKFKNRFACISYNATLPVVVKNLSSDDGNERICETIDQLKAFIKDAVNTPSFHRSLRRAGWNA